MYRAILSLLTFSQHQSKLQFSYLFLHQRLRLQMLWEFYINLVDLRLIARALMKKISKEVCYFMFNLGLDHRKYMGTGYFLIMRDCIDWMRFPSWMNHLIIEFLPYSWAWNEIILLFLWNRVYPTIYCSKLPILLWPSYLQILSLLPQTLWK